MAGSWQPADGRLALSQYDISVENAGTLGMTFDLGGYTPDFIKSLQDMQKKMAAQPEGADNSAQGMAMLGLMQQLTFNGATIRFDDDSLTGKVLDYRRASSREQPEDIANQAKAMLPFLMAQLNNPELTQQVTDRRRRTYLDEPKSIEISAAPAVAGAVRRDHGRRHVRRRWTCRKTLGVTVTANEQ